MAPSSETASTLSEAIAAHRAGRRQAAEAAYRQVLAAAPAEVTALTNLGALLAETGRAGAGRQLLEQAVGQPGAGPDSWANLASARRAEGAHAAAMAAAGEALARQPNHAAARYNRAQAALAAGELATAAADLDALLAQRGDNPALLYERGRTHLAAGEPAAAATVLDRAQAARPGEPAIALQAAAAHNDAGEPDAALAALDAVAGTAGRGAAWLYQRGRAWRALGEPAQAEAAWAAALEQAPGDTRAANALAGLRYRRGDLHDAERVLRTALAHSDTAAAPEEAGRLWNSLANVYQAQDRIPDATQALEAALRLVPDLDKSYGTYLLWLHYDPEISQEALFRAHTAWRDQFFAGLEAQTQAPQPGPAEKTPLTVGLVGTKFRRHPQLWLTLPGLEALDPAAIRLIVYDFTSGHDDFTARLRAAAALWRQMDGLDDAATAAQIRADGVDVLINKPGVAEARMGIFARRPAPVQVQWGGQHSTTLASMDWFLGDAWEIPPADAPWYTERIYRLPRGYAVYNAPHEAPPVGPLPARRKGYVTFGCFNQPAKLNPAIAAVWAQILAAVPDSRLVLRGRVFDDPQARAPLLAMLAQAGIERQRLVLYGWRRWAESMASYNGIDIALDPWPYSGGLTTIEALWMGVPTVTLPGRGFAGRHAASHLAQAGLSDWIVSDSKEYVAKARAWAQDRDALADLRAQLRDRVAASPLCDGPGFARDFEAALRYMYGHACAQRQHGE